MRALEPNASDRYASALELANDLDEFLREPGRKSGPVRVAQYIDDLRALEAGEKRPELVIAGEAWLDDDGEDVLDFDRSFSTVKREAPPKEAFAPAPAPAPAPPSAAATPPPATSDSISGPVPLAVVPSPVAVLTPRRPAGDEEQTTVADEQKAADLARSIDPDIGDDGPTDAVPLMPEMDLGISSEEIPTRADPSSFSAPLPAPPAPNRDHTAPATPASLADLKPSFRAKDDDTALERLVEKEKGRRPAQKLPPLDPMAEMAEDMSKTLEARPRPMRPVVLDTKEVPLDGATPMPRRRKRRRSGPQTIDLMLPKKEERPAPPEIPSPPDDAAPKFSFGSSFVDRRARPSLKLSVTAIAVIFAFVLLIFLLTRV
jgi:hypothetical protein